MIQPILPFARGSVASGASTDGTLPINALGATVTLSDTNATTGVPLNRPDLVGLEVEVRDTVHGTNRLVTLVAVQNVSGSNLTLRPAGQYLAVNFATGNYAPMCFVQGIGGAAATEVMIMPDDKYGTNTVVPDNDWFWAVKKGPVYATVNTGAVAVGDTLTFAADGGVINAVLTTNAREYIAGTAMRTANGSVANTTTNTTVMLVEPVIKKSYVYAN